jgi:hypothetical protein
MPEDAIEEKARRSVLVRGADLAEDLALTRNERIEAGGDAEEMERRSTVAQPVERVLDVRQRRDPASLGLVGVLRREVDLGPVARREHDGFAELACERVGGVLLQRDALPLFDRRVVVRGADEDEMHQAKWAAGRARRTTMTRTKPASAR